MSRGSEYAHDVSGLYSQLGEVYGRKAANVGAIWGGALSNIGSYISQIPQQQAELARAKNQAEETALRRQELERQATRSAQEDAEDQKIRDLFAQPELPKPDVILRTVGPKKGIPIINGLAALRQDPQGDPEKSLKLLQQVANGLNALPEDLRAQAYPDIVKSFEQRGIVKPGLLQPEYSSEYWKFIMGTGQEPPKPKEPELVAQPGPNGPVYGPKVVGAPVYEKPGAVAGEAKVGSFEDFVTRKYGANPTPEQVLAARKAYGQADDRPAVNVNVGGADDVKETIRGMKEGTIPPQLPGRASKEYTAMMAEAHRQGYDLAGAVTDWQATQKHIATLNGAQQTRMAQAIDNAAHSLDVIQDLADQWDGGKFPPLNKARLALAKNGALGAKAQQIATNLEAQISDVTSELGNVYMGGNSPTDHALGLAAKNLSADWTKEQLKSALNLARTNLTIRQNSMRNVGVAGASPTNPYAPQPAKADPLGIR